MSRIEPTRICRSIDNTTSTSRSGEQIESMCHNDQPSSVGEKRLNYALQSRRNQFNGHQSADRHQREGKFLNKPQQLRIDSPSQTRGEEVKESVSVSSQPNLSHLVEPLQAAIGAVDLGEENHADPVPSVAAAFSSATVAFNENKSKGEKEEEESPLGTNCTTLGGSSGMGVHAASLSACQVTILANNPQSTLPHHQQQCSLKPILKRKDVHERAYSVPQTGTLPPPILKRRDSLHDVFPGPLQYSSTNQPSSVVSTQSSKLASILKNRQPRGSYSFDDNINAETSDDSSHHLKPILKKKSWSIEERVLSGSSSGLSTESVKGILKTSDKSINSPPSVSSCLPKVSTVEESVPQAFSIYPDSISPNRAALKGILKSALRNRSTSLSPCTSSDSLIEESTDLDPFNSSQQHIVQSAFRKKTSLEDVDWNISSPSLLDKGESLDDGIYPEDSNHHSSSVIIKATMKKHEQCSDTPQHSSGEHSPELDVSNDSSDHSDHNQPLGQPSSMDSSGVKLRQTGQLRSEQRPKSCLVGAEIGRASITDRLSQLKQNGEQAWKCRVNKPDVEKEIKSGGELQTTPNSSRASGIANRLSSLVESQDKWRNRVTESDAKQFTVASKTSTPSSSDKVVLRNTPKRIGLRGSTLNEKALNSVSSKLNSVLRSDKSLLSSSPITPKKETEKSSLIFPLSNCKVDETREVRNSADVVYLMRPDDEESFGSFYGFDQSTYDHIISKTPLREDDEPLSLDSLEPISLPLLSNAKKCRIQAPKRRAASTRNPIKMLHDNSIIVDSYNEASNVPSSPTSATSGRVDALSRANPNLAISALAGLASTEDFKSIASKLRNTSSSTNITGNNDTWRTYDLKNSLQSKMLILVKGRRRAQIRLVEPSWLSLSHNDSFILVTKDTIYGFIGKLSNIIERTKCIEVAELIKKRKDLCYRSTANALVLIDCHSDSVLSNLYSKMLPLLKELGYTEDKRSQFDQILAEAEAVDDDEFYEESMICTNMVYQVKSDKSTADLVPVEQYWGRMPRHQVLQPDLALIFDYGTEMYIWLGKNVSNAMRKKAVEAAKDLWLKGYDYSECEMSPFGVGASCKEDTRPAWAWFTRVNQNMEPILFKDKFFNWPAFTLTRTEKSRKSSITKQTDNLHKVVKKDLSQELNLFPVDAECAMLNKPPNEPNLVLESVSLGRGAGDIIKDEDGLSVKIISLEAQCFYIDDVGNKVELSGADCNYLFTGESYFIRWRYRLTRISRNLKTGGESRYSQQHGGRDRLCYFIWQGRDARNTQRGLTALNAIDKLREEGAFQVFIENGYEDAAFLRIFNGSLVILLGKRGQGARDNCYHMLTLQDTLPEESFLFELDCSFKNLRSRRSFIFINQNQTTIYVWHGSKVDDSRRKRTKQFVEEKILSARSKEFSILSDPYTIVELEEGKESKEFFDIFANVNSESTLKRASKSSLNREIYFSLIEDSRGYDFTPRLFQLVTSPENIFEAKEIVSGYMPPNDSGIVLHYPFRQDDLYERAKTRPTFFLFDNHYEIYLWECKFPFFLGPTRSEERESATGDGLPRMINIEEEIRTECHVTTGSLAQLWHAERRCALETTLHYCHAKNKAEPPKAYVISAGLEPDSFCGLFPTWTFYDNVAKLHIEDGRKPGEQILVQEVLSQLQDIDKSTYTYEELKRRPLPEGINVLCLESYLDDSEFESTFGMNREEFCALPTWKQRMIKQEKELF